MMKPKRIMVFCGVNEHISRMSKLLSSLSMLEGTDFALASFGASDNNLSNFSLRQYQSKHKRLPITTRPLLWERYAKDNLFQFYCAPFQDFLPINRDWHCCELLGEINIAKHFYGLGYDLVYICHTDIEVPNEFFSKVEPLMKGEWSFLAHATRGLDNNIELQEKVFAIPSNFKIRQSCRISQECIVFNKDFIKTFYEVLWNEAIAWDLMFNELSLFGDVALLDLAPGLFGYKAILTPAFVKHP